MCLLTCRLKSTIANTANTETQLQNNYSTNMQNKNTKETK